MPDVFGRLLIGRNHPNIATLFGITEAGGVRALAMEFVEGQTLACPQPVDVAVVSPGRSPKPSSMPIKEP